MKLIGEIIEGITPDLVRHATRKADYTNSCGDVRHDMCEMLIRTSTDAREAVTASVLGYQHISKKKGRDAFDSASNTYKEIKTKIYDPTNLKCIPTDGESHFSDYTRARFLTDQSMNLRIVHSLFVGSWLAYVVEFGFDSISKKLDKTIQFECEGKPKTNRYVRAAKWNYKQWLNDSTLQFHYIDWELIGLYPKCINGSMMKSFRDVIARQEKASGVLEFMV